MPHYRAYIVGLDGHFLKSIDLSCADDMAAIESAKQLVDGNDIELWQQGRFVAKLGVHLQELKISPEPDTRNSV